ncbi:MAG: hypothetical protein AAB403_06445 [Planctomycetota bacterium]
MAKKVKSPPQKHYICFESTPASQAFRRTAGDITRLLSTLYVALETLEVNDPVRPDDLSFGWSMPSGPKEWEETRNFALRGAIVAIVDGLDQYMRVLSRVPGLVAPELDNVLNGRRGPGEERRPTIAMRLSTLSTRYLGVVRDEHIAAMDLLTTWRNTFVHRDYRFGLSSSVRKSLVNSELFFSKEHGGADILGTLSRFEARKPPTIIDLSTLVSSAQRIARAIDEHLLQIQNGPTYAKSLFRYAIAASDNAEAFVKHTFERGGKQSVGRVHSTLLRLGGSNDRNHSPNALVVTDLEMNRLFALSQTNAAEVFGISVTKAAAHRR